jgi:hypothetical protein
VQAENDYWLPFARLQNPIQIFRLPIINDGIQDNNKKSEAHFESNEANNHTCGKETYGYNKPKNAPN